jgi:hypothetical protein
MRTAVDQLIEKMSLEDVCKYSNELAEAKEMEKERMINAFEESRLTHPMIGFKHETFKDYYNETFNTNEK